MSSNPPEANWFWPLNTCLRNSIISFFNYSEETILRSSSSGSGSGSASFANPTWRFTSLVRMTGDLFHVSAARPSLVTVVGAVADFEGYRVGLTQEGAEDHLFALRESALDVRPVARLVQPLAGLRFSVSNDDAHAF